jgi:hypothetical protein
MWMLTTPHDFCHEQQRLLHQGVQRMAARAVHEGQREQRYPHPHQFCRGPRQESASHIHIVITCALRVPLLSRTYVASIDRYR